ncbi:MAG: ribonuclease R [Gemmatimonadota bacterium]|nr:MAG: ribonuclease R [Gemmatimonadota bacterium]
MIEKKDIVRFLGERAERPVRLKELARGLHLAASDYGRLRRMLREMEEAGEVYRVRRRKFALPERINLTVGRLEVTRGGKGFVVPDSPGIDVFIPATRLGNAYDGDRVVARLEHRRRGRNPEGSIVRVLERARSQVVGVFRAAGRFAYVAPSEAMLRRDVFVPRSSAGEARQGDLVVVRIVDWGSEHHGPVGEVIEVLGRPGDPGVDVLAIVHAHELTTSFSSGVLGEAGELAKREVTEKDRVGRKDFRDSLVFTIDPVDAKDHDDALSVEQAGADRWVVHVHIADVSFYVIPGSATDVEARRRGTSVYLVDRVLPMLPEVLSTDLCSLKPGRDRLTLSVSLELDGSGRVLKMSLAEGVIRSRRALSYEEAQAILDGDRAAETDLQMALEWLRGLARQLRRRRQARGGLDFDLPEARVVVNAAGEPTEIERLLRLDTHRLVEEFMILANESIAQATRKRGLECIYRIHDAPDPDRLERLAEFVGSLGISLRQGSVRGLQRLLETVEGRPEEAVVTMLVLRSMKQAIYSAHAFEHFGLGSPAYTHFTSPIRRYPDLMVHRIVRAGLLGCDGSEAGGPWAVEELQAIATHASFRERQAMEAERDSVDLKRIEFMERHLGDVFAGTVSGVTAFGFFVLLDEVLAEGLVHVSRLEDDYYHYVEEEYALVGEAGGRRYRLGDRVAVEVVRVDREARQLDLALAGNSGEVRN